MSKEDSLIEVEFDGLKYGVVLAVQGIFLDKVKKMIVEELKATISAFKHVEIFSDFIKIYQDKERKLEINDDVMPLGNRFYAKIVVHEQKLPEGM
jgi:hypothetical protein